MSPFFLSSVCEFFKFNSPLYSLSSFDLLVIILNCWLPFSWKKTKDGFILSNEITSLTFIANLLIALFISFFSSYVLNLISLISSKDFLPLSLFSSFVTGVVIYKISFYSFKKSI